MTFYLQKVRLHLRRDIIMVIIQRRDSKKKAEEISVTLFHSLSEADLGTVILSACSLLETLMMELPA